MQHVRLNRRDRFRGSGARFLALVMMIVMVITVIPQVQAAVTKEQINNLKSQAATLEQKKAGLQKELDQVANSKNAAVQQKTILEQKINVLREQIAISEQTIAELGRMIEQKEIELAQALEEEARYFNLFCERVRSMEEDGELSYWAIFFQVEDFAELLDRVNQVGEIMDYDNYIMDELEKARLAVEAAKAELEESKAAEEEVRNNLNAQKAELQAEENRVDGIIAQLNQESAAYASQLEDLEADANALAKEIVQAEQTYAAQLEAQRRAEEARRAQEAAAARARAAQASGGSVTPTTAVGTGRAGSGGFMWPLSGYTRVTSPFGYRICPFHGRELHGGCDIPAPGGTPIMAAKSGVVIISSYGSSYGNHVTIAHTDGTRTLYAHMSSRAVSAGSSVSQGQVIGYVGSTGSSTGNHLHFEVWNGSSSSSRVNPMNYF